MYSGFVKPVGGRRVRLRPEPDSDYIPDEGMSAKITPWLLRRQLDGAITIEKSKPPQASPPPPVAPAPEPVQEAPPAAPAAVRPRRKTTAPLERS